MCGQRRSPEEPELPSSILSKTCGRRFCEDHIGTLGGNSIYSQTYACKVCAREVERQVQLFIFFTKINALAKFDKLQKAEASKKNARKRVKAAINPCHWLSECWPCLSVIWIIQFLWKFLCETGCFCLCFLLALIVYVIV